MMKTGNIEPAQNKHAALHSKQMSVYAAPHRFKVVVAGRRWGKTKLAIASMIEAAQKPKGKIWYVAPTYTMAKQIVWDDLRDNIPRRWVRKINETYMRVTLVNGTQLQLKGADRPDTLRGVGLTHVVMDEFQDMRPEVWDKVLRPTLATTRGHALFIGTPKSYNHLHDVYQRGQNKLLRARKEWCSWQFKTSDSPFVPLEEIEQARRDLDPKTFRQEFEASFESMSGQVYYAFDRKQHVGKYSFNPKLPIWVGQDFNMDPMASAIIQPQPSGELWVVSEVVIYNSNVSEVCDELERRFWRQMNQTRIYPDPAGGNRSHARGESALDVFRERGFHDIRYRKKHPPVQDRVNSVNALLMSAAGDIRMRIDESCRHVIDGMEQVIYRPGSSEVDKSLGKEHVLDALGYPVEKEYPTRRVVVLGANI